MTNFLNSCLFSFYPKFLMWYNSRWHTSGYFILFDLFKQIKREIPCSNLLLYFICCIAVVFLCDCNLESETSFQRLLLASITNKNFIMIKLIFIFWRLIYIRSNDPFSIRTSFLKQEGQSKHLFFITWECLNYIIWCQNQTLSF